jgi:hypothetical protein
VAASPGTAEREPLFQESQTALARSGVRMYLNMGLVQDSRYFRNEWLYKNLEETAATGRRGAPGDAVGPVSGRAAFY